MIERDFDVSFIADLALREKQIQQNYRPIIAVHKWFARRPGTLFRGLLLSEFGKCPSYIDTEGAAPFSAIRFHPKKKKSMFWLCFRILRDPGFMLVTSVCIPEPMFWLDIFA